MVRVSTGRSVNLLETKYISNQSYFVFHSASTCSHVLDHLDTKCTFDRIARKRIIQAIIKFWSLFQIQFSLRKNLIKHHVILNFTKSCEKKWAVYWRPGSNWHLNIVGFVEKTTYSWRFQHTVSFINEVRMKSEFIIYKWNDKKYNYDPQIVRDSTHSTIIALKILS